jgi:hypothetical protein
LTPERSIDLCLQTFPKLLLLLVPKVTTRSLYPECIANLKLPIDTFYRERCSGVNIAKRNITTGLFGLLCMQHCNLSFFLSFLQPCWSRTNCHQIACDAVAAEPYGPQISENWPRTKRATVPQLAMQEHLGVLDQFLKKTLVTKLRAKQHNYLIVSAYSKEMK